MLRPHVGFLTASFRNDKTEPKESKDETALENYYDINYLISRIPLCFQNCEKKSRDNQASVPEKMTNKALLSRDLVQEDDLTSEVSSEDYEFVKDLGKLSIVNNDSDLLIRDESSVTIPKEVKEATTPLQMRLVLLQENQNEDRRRVKNSQNLSVVENRSDPTIRDDDSETTILTTNMSSLQIQSTAETDAVEIHEVSLPEQENEDNKPVQDIEDLSEMEIERDCNIRHIESETTQLVKNESTIEPLSKVEPTAVKMNADSFQEKSTMMNHEEKEDLSDIQHIESETTLLVKNESTIETLSKTEPTTVKMNVVSIQEKSTLITHEEKEDLSEFPSTPIRTQLSEDTSSAIDLSGTWKIIVDDDFRKEYDDYLKCLGFNRIFRSVALRVIGQTVEEIQQLEEGQQLVIKGTNPKGVWERTLMTRPYKVITAQNEELEGEAWWQDNRHNSFLRGSKKYGGGDFGAVRYIDEEGLYICDSTFIFDDKTKDPAHVCWRFKKST